MMLLLAATIAARRPPPQVAAVALVMLAPIPFLLVVLLAAVRHAIHRPDEDRLALPAAMASELAGGRSPRAALIAATAGEARFNAVHRLASAGADASAVGAALADAVDDRNGPIVAGAVEAALRHGGRAATLMAGLVDLEREEAELARELEVALAPVRVSMIVVGGLPLLYLADRALRGVLPIGGPERLATSLGVVAIGLGIGLAVLLVGHGARAARRDEDDLARRIWLGLAAGDGLAVAIASAAEATGHPARQGLRAARIRGLAAALDAATGPDASLLRALGRAYRTGAPLLPLVEAHLRAAREDRRARGLAAIRALPVKLTVPVAMFMLPGFVLVAVVPTVVGSVRELVGPLLG